MVHLELRTSSHGQDSHVDSALASGHEQIDKVAMRRPAGAVYHDTARPEGRSSDWRRADASRRGWTWHPRGTDRRMLAMRW